MWLKHMLNYACYMYIKNAFNIEHGCQGGDSMNTIVLMLSRHIISELNE